MKTGKVKASSFAMPPDLVQLVKLLDQDAEPVLINQVNDLFDQRSRQIDQEPGAFLDTLFLKAISDRFSPTPDGYRDGQQTGHIYLKQFEIPQIVLFDVLINQFPFVNLAHGIVNDTIVTAMGDAKEAVLIDVGIGRGIQTMRLLQALQHHPTLQQLTIIGVEPYKEAIDHTQQAINEAAKDKTYKVSFKGIQCMAEEMDAATLQSALPAGYDQLIINASLTLHHIPSREQRHACLRLLRHLRPGHLLLTEPDSDHYEPNWPQRVQNAWTHYGAVFSVIDCLEIDMRMRNGLKLFFGREIEDVVAHADDHRYERHEPVEQWIGYCTANGFGITNNFTIGKKHRSPIVQVKLSPTGYLAMEHGGLNVLSLIHATSEK